MDDYSSLRKQINGQFNLIAQIFTASVIASGALLGYIIKLLAGQSLMVNSIEEIGTSTNGFMITPFLMLTPLIIALPCAYLISTLRKEIFHWATYIKVFIEKDDEGYETRIYRFREKYHPTESFLPIALTYLAFVVVCIGLFCYMFIQSKMYLCLLNLLWLIVPFICLGLFLFWYCDYRDIPLKCSKEYEEKWRSIKEENTNPTH